MEILRELSRLQHELGYLSDETLREIAARRNVPLYRLEGLVSFYPSFRREPPPPVVIQVCRDVACAMAGGKDCLQAVKTKLAERTDVEFQEVSCLGRCDAAPAACINEIPLAPAALSDQERVQAVVESPGFLKLESLTGTDANWRCDPYSSPRARYGTVRSLAEQGRKLGEHCIGVLLDSGLRGMGGAGFPTGRKWQLVAEVAATPKYVICNADESEPGTFKDREILAELPHLVIEGMMLAGLTIGAEQGIVYLRHEYLPEKLRLQAAINEARRRGVLGQDAAGSGQRFDIEIFVSPGGYILGEETALLEALEDKRGEPRNKPPYPGTHGLWGKPTLINNVETFAFATSIVHYGNDWWQSQGRGDYAGLKFVSVSGDISKPGVYEIPVGTTVSEVVELAGGMKDGRKLQAFLPGGASSNFLTAEHTATPLDFDEMKKAGSMLGTGAVIVIGEGRNLFALATNLVRFFRNESCGKCVPCRIGSNQAVNLLEGVQKGSTDASELSILPELDDTLEQTSICGLGQVALKPVLSMMKHFPDQIPASSA